MKSIIGGSGVPEEPDWPAIYTDELNQAAAKEHWREIINEMREAGTLTVANGHSIRCLVFFRIECDVSLKNVAEQGKIIRAKRTKRPMINPEWTALKQAREQLNTLESELGISPRRRNAAGKVNRQKRKATAADAYLKEVAK